MFINIFSFWVNEWIFRIFQNEISIQKKNRKNFIVFSVCLLYSHVLAEANVNISVFCFAFFQTFMSCFSFSQNIPFILDVQHEQQQQQQQRRQNQIIHNDNLIWKCNEIKSKEIRIFYQFQKEILIDFCEKIERGKMGEKHPLLFFVADAGYEMIISKKFLLVNFELTINDDLTYILF